MERFKPTILAALQQQHPQLGDLILAMLTRDRSQFIHDVDELMGELNGQCRLALFGAMIEDGGADLIPVFIKGILQEGNVLFGKSLLLCYAHFEHVAAMEALRAVQPKLHFKLQSVYQRVIVKFNGKFKENFYMEEFKNGLKNAKRMKHAVAKMLEEPNPVYVPFLNKMIVAEETTFREPGVRVLLELGDATSVDSLLCLLSRLLVEQEKIGKLANFLLDKEMLALTRLVDYLTELGRVAGWEASLPEQLAAEVLEKKLGTTLAWVAHSFGPVHPVLWEDVTKFLRHYLSKGSVVAEQKLRLDLAVKTDMEAKTRVANTITKAVGKIGRRFQMPQLAGKVEAAIPQDHPKRESFLVSMLAGYQSEKALVQLLTLLDDAQDPKVLLEITTALDAFDLDQIPQKIYQLAADPDHKFLRRKSLELIATGKPDWAKVAVLLDHEAAAVTSDAIAMIAAHGQEAGYPLLVERLTEEKPLPYQEAVITALGAFPRNHTGEVVYPFFLLPHNYDIRFVALQTLIKAGGSHNMSLIFKGLASYDEKKVPEMLTSILRAVETLSPEEMPHDVVACAQEWGSLLNHDNEKFRVSTLTILEKADWDRATNHDEWLQALSVASKHPMERHVMEQRRIKGLVLKIRSRQMTGRDQGKEGKTREKITALMDHLEAGSHYEKLEALRKLNISYKPGLLEGKDSERLVYLVDVFFKESEGDPASLKPAISVAAKVHHPSLQDRISCLQTHQDADLARFARAAMGLLKKETGHIDIKSIFIMEEKTFMGKVLARLLGNAGYEVAIGADTDEALKAMTEKSYDLLIVGYQLAHGSGIDFLRATRREHIKPARVLFLANNKDEAAHRDMMAAGANAVMVKPFSNDALFAMVKNLEERRKVPAAG